MITCFFFGWIVLILLELFFTTWSRVAGWMVFMLLGTFSLPIVMNACELWRLGLVVSWLLVSFLFILVPDLDWSWAEWLFSLLEVFDLTNSLIDTLCFGNKYDYDFILLFAVFIFSFSLTLDDTDLLLCFSLLALAFLFLEYPVCSSELAFDFFDFTRYLPCEMFEIWE